MLNIPPLNVPLGSTDADPRRVSRSIPEVAETLSRFESFLADPLFPAGTRGLLFLNIDTREGDRALDHYKVDVDATMIVMAMIELLDLYAALPAGSAPVGCPAATAMTALHRRRSPEAAPLGPTNAVAADRADGQRGHSAAVGADGDLGLDIAPQLLRPTTDGDEPTPPIINGDAFMKPFNGVGVINCYRAPLPSRRVRRRRMFESSVALLIVAIAVWQVLLSASPIERLLILSDEDHARPRTVPFATAAADRTAVR